MTIHVDGTEVVTLKQIADALGTSVNALAVKKSRGRIRLSPITTLGREHLYAKADITRLEREAR
jgi:hypothetical protein